MKNDERAWVDAGVSELEAPRVGVLVQVQNTRILSRLLSLHFKCGSIVRLVVGLEVAV